ncbi:uncharacterized protein P7C70_g8129, partial [Phenoliferia sp. Uapishka_3]
MTAFQPSTTTSFETSIPELRDAEAGSGRPPIARKHYDDDPMAKSLISAPAPTEFYSKLGNPTVMGLAAHAVTLMLLSTQFMRWRGVTAPQAYVGNLFTSAQWCLVKGETFTHVVFDGAILTPSFGVSAAYEGDVGTSNSTATEYDSLATFLLVWSGAFTVIFLASLKTNVCLVMIFLGVILGVWLLGQMYIELAEVARDTGKGSTAMAIRLSQAGGACLFFSACFGFYLMVVMLFESVDFPLTLPVGNLAPLWPKRKRD